MGYQIIKQPDGLLAILSSHTDTLVVWDADRVEVIDWFIEIEVARVKAEVGAKIDLVETGEKRPYYQFTRTWDEAVALDREHGGEYGRLQDGDPVDSMEIEGEDP
jgi:DNA-binding IclR family transcriptional regulator